MDSWSKSEEEAPKACQARLRVLGQARRPTNYGLDGAGAQAVVAAGLLTATRLTCGMRRSCAIGAKRSVGGAAFYGSQAARLLSRRRAPP